MSIFLDHYIAKPLSVGDPITLYKLLQVMESSLKSILLATKIKESLNIESLQDKISGELNPLDAVVSNTLIMPWITTWFSCYTQKVKGVKFHD